MNNQELSKDEKQILNNTIQKNNLTEDQKKTLTGVEEQVNTTAVNNSLQNPPQ